MFSTIIRRALHPNQLPPFNLHTNPFKAKRLWPPDFSQIDKKHQFRLERKYKRRAKLKWARPTWTKFIKVTQLGLIVFISVYGVLFLDWSNQGDPNHKPFNAIRSWFFGMTGNIWTNPNDIVRKKKDDASPTAS